MLKVREEGQFQEAITDSKPVVAVFKTTWCGDCRYLDMFMDDIVKKYESSLTFIEIDRDELPDLCYELNILGIPSFVVFNGGKEITRFVSKLRKTQAEVEQFLDRSLEVAGAMN